MTALTRRFEAALSLAAEAGSLAQRMRPAPGAASITLKGAQDWLTEADGAVERFLSEQIASHFPEDGFQGEEHGRARQGALRWVVDPIDGTANYARGATRWCVSVGLLEGDTPLLGVLAAPDLQETYAAVAGRGATLNGAPIRAAGTMDVSRAIVECGWSPRRPNEAWLALCTRILGVGAVVRAGGSGAMGLAEVACGRIDAYAELHINFWDVAAGLAILAEAGASVSPFLAQGGAERGAPILAAAPGVAAAVVQAAALPE